MDLKRGYSSRTSRTGQNSSDSSSNSPASPAPTSPVPGMSKPSAGGNSFANDGSFMEMFKRKMEEERRRKELAEGGEPSLNPAEEGQSCSQDRKPAALSSFVGKRRGGAKLALKTGMVAKKQKVESEEHHGKSDAWSKYMAEVKKYKAHQCGDDDKTRPLVK